VLDEIPSRRDSNPHRAEVPRADDVHEDDGCFSGPVDLARHAETPRAIPLERQCVGQTGSLDTRERRHAANDLVTDRRPLLERRLAGNVDPRRHGPRRFEPELDVEQLEEAARQESRAHEQNPGQGDLRHHQPAPNPGLTDRVHHSATVFLKRALR
jgi:hypothetical protein